MRMRRNWQENLKRLVIKIGFFICDTMNDFWYYGRVSCLCFEMKESSWNVEDLRSRSGGIDFRRTQTKL
jgi:hypothetical protein